MLLQRDIHSLRLQLRSDRWMFRGAPSWLVAGGRKAFGGDRVGHEPIFVLRATILLTLYGLLWTLHDQCLWFWWFKSPRWFRSPNLSFDMRWLIEDCLVCSGGEGWINLRLCTFNLASRSRVVERHWSGEDVVVGLCWGDYAVKFDCIAECAWQLSLGQWHYSHHVCLHTCGFDRIVSGNRHRRTRRY